MSWVAIGVGVAGAAIGGAGSIIGGQEASETGFRVGDTPGAGFNPASDPLLAALQSNALISQGVFDPSVLQAARPLSRLANAFAANPGDVRRDDLQDLNLVMRSVSNQITNGLKRGEDVGEIVRNVRGALAQAGPRLTETFNRALRASGVASIGDLIRDEQTFSANFGLLEEQGAGVAGEVQQGRFDALRSIAGIQSDFVAPTADDIQNEIARQQEVQNAGVLEAANAGGFNPANNLLLSRNSALQNALTLLGGQQGLQTNALGALTGSINPNSTGALQTAALAQQGNLGAGQIAAGQSTALANLQAQTGIAGAQAQGAGIAGAANSINSGISNAILFDLLSQSGAQPGALSDTGKILRDSAITAGR